MELLFSGQTLSLQEAKVGSFVIFSDSGRQRYGTIYNSTAAGSTHQSVLELAPERRRLTDLREGLSVFQLDSAKIELIPNNNIVSTGDIPKDAENYIGIDGRSIIAGFLHRQENHKFVNIGSGVLLADWPSQMTMWFKHWRIVVLAADRYRILYDSVSPVMSSTNDD